MTQITRGDADKRPVVDVHEVMSHHPRSSSTVEAIADATYLAGKLRAALNRIDPDALEDPTIAEPLDVLLAVLELVIEHPVAGLAPGDLAPADELEPLRQAALPADAPGAWIRQAIDRERSR